MRAILKGMIFFRNKKPAPAPEPEKKAPPAPKKAEAVSSSKPTKPLQEIAHTRVLTAEGWRRLMEKRAVKKNPK
jgi:hypothetical protein